MNAEFLLWILLITVIVFLLGCLGGSVLFWRRLQGMQQALLQVQTTQSGTVETLRQLQEFTQERIQRLEVAQAATQTTVTTTQQETQRFVANLETLQHSSQALMLEIKTLHSASQALMTDWQKETTQLSHALRTNYQQGMWGEHALRQILDFAGMTHHCDFEIKHRLPNGQEPDCLIYMPNNRTIAIDAKAPSQVFVDAIKSEDEETRTKKLKAYASRVKDMLHELANKEYWKQLQPSPSLVILFIPNEAMFRAALEYDHGLLEIATRKKVLLASPVTLIALLKALEYGWDQESRAENVQLIVDQSKELQKELVAWFRQWQSLRKAIQVTSTEFSRVATQYETHILPVIQALGALDNTQLKEKAFELKPLETPLNIPEESDPEAATQEEREGHPWQDLVVTSLKKAWDTLPLDIFSLKKEQSATDQGEPL